VDSIRWVMGEQSPRQLRGRNMEDVLFNGAKSYSPATMAEVTLVLSNENGPGPGPTLGPSEISITRRLYRSGDSEYLINRVPCRLKDITQFFMDTGMGTKAYAIIEQGRIGWLVDGAPMNLCVSGRSVQNLRGCSCLRMLPIHAIGSAKNLALILKTRWSY